MDQNTRIANQSAEFTAVHELAQHMRGMPAVVDDDFPSWRHDYEGKLRALATALATNGRFEGVFSLLPQQVALRTGLTFAAFRIANVARCLKWHPLGLHSWSPSDWLTACMGELGELAGEVKMFNRERDGLVGNKEEMTPDERKRRMENEAADVVTYLDLFCAERGIDLAVAVARKFNAVSERVGFPDRLAEER
jgi:NTP pyrophosphatase (non-canonical NTP hydrolase)